MSRLLGSALLVALVAIACSGTDSNPETTVAADPAGTGTSAPATSGVPTTEAAPANDDPDPALDYLFALLPTEILTIGAEAWEGGFVGPGSIDHHDGEYHMFYNGFSNRNNPADPGIGHATSRNGLDFFRQSTDPVLDPWGWEGFTGGPGTGISPGNTIVEDDGTWVMYFSTFGLNGRSGSGLIGRATAPGPGGPWTFDEAPLLEPGATGEWDQLSIINPHVVKTADGYLMWYDANMGDLDAKPTRHIGLATSNDGITWTKYDDPETTDPPFHVSDPVLMLSDVEDAWDSFRVYEPTVIPTDDGFVMFYGSDRRYENQLERTWEWGYATSSDGITWERSTANPVWSSIGDVFTGMFSSTGLRTPDGAWRIYVGTQLGISLPTTVRALELNGPLP